MLLNTFIEKIKTNQKVSFDDTMAVINAYYHYTPTTFSNGLDDNAVINEAGTNEGSCKIFAFAQLQHLNQAQTLNLFGDFYQDVLDDPNGNSHQNIRNFMKSAWQGIKFNTPNTLRPK
ncbi:MAG: HopJ type III effector protein [Methyloprofundus sp.]|nr:HopJ type III effector protein [Methyloprofundus sp.]